MPLVVGALEEKDHNPKAGIGPDNWRHSVVESSKQPIEVISQYIGGSNVSCYYYNQILGADEHPKPYDRKQHGVYQQYKKIKNFIIKQQGAITTTDDTSGSGTMKQSGSAIIPPHPSLVPKKYDMLIMDIGEGRAGLFTITRIEKTVIMSSYASKIDFELLYPLDNMVEEQLDRKVVQEFVYNLDYLNNGRDPLLTPEEADVVSRMAGYEEQISYLWSSGHLSYTFHSFMIPGQPDSTYDPYVARAAFDILPLGIRREMPGLKLFNCDDFRIPKFDDIYQAVARRKAWLMGRVVRDYAVITTGAFAEHPLLHGIRWSGIGRVVVPSVPNKDADDNIDLYRWIKSNLAGVTTLTPSPDVDGWTKPIKHRPQGVAYYDCIHCPCHRCFCCQSYGDCDEGTDGDGNGTGGNTNPGGGDPNADIGFDIPAIGPDSYVLTKEFYNKDRNKMTHFERQVLNIIENKPVNASIVEKFVLTYDKWGKLEKFYLGLLLVLLIRAASRGM